MSVIKRLLIVLAKVIGYICLIVVVAVAIRFTILVVDSYIMDGEWFRPRIIIEKKSNCITVDYRSHSA